MQRTYVCGIPLDFYAIDELKNKIFLDIGGGKKKQYVSLNAEIVRDALRNQSLYSILSASSVNYPDGVGVILATRGDTLSRKNVFARISVLINCFYLKGLLRARSLYSLRIAGVDLFTELINDFRMKQERVFLLGTTNEDLKKISEGIQRHAGSVVVGMSAPSIPDCFWERPFDQREGWFKDLISAIKDAKPTIVFACLNHQKQIHLLNYLINNVQSVRGGFGLGGTFDYFSGKRIRASKVIQRSGFEWLWRLIREPSRLQRIVNAVIVFPWLVTGYDRQR